MKDKESDITREPEMVKAYGDTWTLGVHSYLSYLRDRLVVAKELLVDAGSIFVQIGDENVHVVRDVLDEVFGRDNFICLITLRKTTSATNLFLPGVSDFILWYARKREQARYRAIYLERDSIVVLSTMAAWNFAMAHGARSLKMKGRTHRSLKAPAYSQRTTSSPRAWAAQRARELLAGFPSK